MEQTLTTVNMKEATTPYDDAFRNVQGLTWLPWVGQNFSKRQPHKRLLVVGESHYFKGDTPEMRQANRESWLTDVLSTREVALDSLIDRDWTTITLTNIPKLLFKTAEIDRSRFWGDSAYYNLVQRPMDYFQEGQPERPTWDDYVMGWKVFAEVVRIIQPSHCLFIGVTAATSFNLGSVSHTRQVGRTWARVAKLEIAGSATELIFVQHLGKYFSWSKWHDYLQDEHKDFIHWLGAESYANSEMR